MPTTPKRASPRRTKKATKKTTKKTAKVKKKTNRSTPPADLAAPEPKPMGAHRGKKRSSDNAAFHDYFDETVEVTIGEGSKKLTITATRFELVMGRLFDLSMSSDPDVALSATRAVMDRKVSKAPTVIDAKIETANYMESLDMNIAKHWLTAKKEAADEPGSD